MELLKKYPPGKNLIIASNNYLCHSNITAINIAFKIIFILKMGIFPGKVENLTITESVVFNYLVYFLILNLINY